MNEFKVDETKFDEWWEENYMNVSADRSEAFDIYSLGVKHQQAKVGELQNDVSIMLNSHKRMSVGLLQQQSMIEELIKERDELQKRVDAVIIEIENMYLSGAIGFDTVKKLEQALKGEG